MKELQDDVKRQELIKTSNFSECFSFDVASYTRLLRARAGEYIVREGEAPACLYFLASGRAKLYRTLPNGRIALIDFFTAGYFIGEMELVSGANDTESIHAVQAIEDCLFLALPLHAKTSAGLPLKTQLLSDPVFLRTLCRILSQKNYRNILSATKNQAFPLSVRLADFILMTEHAGIYCEKHTQAAEYLGVSYRHLLYVLNQLTEEGALQKVGHALRILDRAKLKKLAGELHPEGCSPQQRKEA